MKNTLEASSDLAFVYVTFGNAADAERIATLALETKLTACANIHAPHVAIYRWKGKIETQSEVVTIFKTSDGRLDDLCAMIAKEHAYDTPCIAVLTPSQMNSKFAEWLRSETK